MLRLVGRATAFGQPAMVGVIMKHGAIFVNSKVSPVGGIGGNKTLIGTTCEWQTIIGGWRALFFNRELSFGCCFVGPD